MTLYATILAGGVGTRLWPRSRQNRPKQFSDIIGNGQTMIQETVQRLNGVVDEERVFVLTGSLYADLVA
jgi:mannose-1-phosphate guanylyltransferase